MTQHDDEQLLTERMYRLGAGVDVPTVDPTDDVRRGRARLRRTRGLMVAAACAAVAVVSVSTALLHGGDDGRAIRPAGGSDRPTAVAPTAYPSPTLLASSAPPNRDPGAARLPWVKPATAQRLQSYRDLVAEHLDPTARHLQRHPDNMQSGGGSLGTKLGWSTPGEKGLGMVEVEVSRNWASSQIHLAHDSWQTVQPVRPGAKAARAVTYYGGMAVSVTRGDGTVVSLDADRLFGNNSRVGISGFDFTVDDLIATAADPRFHAP